MGQEWETTAVVTHLNWDDPGFRNHLYCLDAPSLAQELLRQIPAYIIGYQSLWLQGGLPCYELKTQFANQWGLSCTG